jgi:hypothetical protein
MDSTDPRPAAARARRALGAAAAFAVVLAAQWARDPATLPLTLDNQHYYFVAERAASGVPPHLSHFDSKHELSMVLTAAAIRAGRALGVSDVPAARAASMVALALAAAALWALARDLSGDALAAWLALGVLLAFDGLLVMGAMGAQPKVFLVLFAACLGLWLERRPCLAGSAAAAAFLCWQPALLLLAAAALALALAGRSLHALGRLLVGAAGTVALYHAAFWLVGALPELVEQVYRFPAGFMTHPPNDLGTNVTRFFRLSLGATAEGGWLLLFVVLLGGFGAAFLRRPRRVARERPGLVFLPLAGAASLAFTVYDYGTFVDDFFVLPWVAALGGLGLAWLARRIGRGRPRAIGLAAATAALAATFWLAALRPVPVPLGPTLADQQRLALEVRELIDEGRSVWAVGCTHLLAFAHADNHVPYGFFFRGMGPYLRERTHAPEGWRPLRDGGMPDVILVSRPFTGWLPESREWFERDYRERTPLAFRLQDVRVFWRREAPPDPRVDGR